jgi:hypothetical protein
MKYPDGRIYKGKWYRGQRIYGWESFDDGTEYTGNFEADKVNGHGSSL